MVLLFMTWFTLPYKVKVRGPGISSPRRQESAEKFRLEAQVAAARAGDFMG